MKIEYKYNNTMYLLENCTLNDIPSHTEKVLSYWKQAGANIDIQKALVKSCIDKSYAWKLTNNNTDYGFIYCYPMETPYIVSSHLLWFKDKRFFCILCMYMRYYKSISKIRFTPHGSRTVVPFRFAMDTTSIYNYRTYGTPLEVNLFSKDSELLFNAHYTRYNIESYVDGRRS